MTHRPGHRAALALTTLLMLAAAVPGLAQEVEAPFSVAKVFFQLNDTDGDLGFHAIIDGEPWKTLAIESPSERTLLSISTRSQLRLQGLTELRFESAEPNFDDLDPSEFFSRFPPGIYEVEATTLDGGELESEVEITHVLPAAPENLRVSGMPVPEDCDEGPVPVIAGAVVISWDAVTTSHPEIGDAGPIDIVRYELAVEREAPTALTLTADLEPGTTTFTVPSELIASGDEIKFQVLATDAGGNETSSESCFEVE